MTILGHAIVAIFINWFPMLLLIGAWAWFCLRMPQFQKDYLAILARQAEILERIAAALEKRAA